MSGCLASHRLRVSAGAERRDPGHSLLDGSRPAASCDFYSRVLGGTVVLEGTPSMIKLSNSWIIMNSGGGSTPDKPGISVVNYEPGDTTSIFLNLRVADIEASYRSGARKAPPLSRPRSTAGPKSAATCVTPMATSSRWVRRPACSGVRWRRMEVRIELPPTGDTDNRSCCFAKAFDQELIKDAIKHARTKPFDPQTNGKVCATSESCSTNGPTLGPIAQKRPELEPSTHRSTCTTIIGTTQQSSVPHSHLDDQSVASTTWWGRTPREQVSRTKGSRRSGLPVVQDPIAAWCCS